MNYIPALDGVRAVAVVGVMLFHLNVPGFSLGWAGVPLFFVLSGYLITGILAESKGADFRSYIGRFYARRTLRIFPLFYVYLAVNFALLLLTERPTAGYSWYVLYLQNYHIGNALHAGQNLPGIVGHTWSLAVEEQFYLIWPFIVYLLSRKQLIAVCVALVILAPLARFAILQSTGNVPMSLVAMPSCLDMMAYGGLLAVLPFNRKSSRMVYGLLAAGVVVSAYAISTLGMEAFWTPRTWAGDAYYLYTSMALVFGALIWIAATNSGNPITKALTLKPLQFTGKISYGLYMWHPLCFMAIERLFSGFKLGRYVASMAAVFAVATISYYVMERHFLKMKVRHQDLAPK